MDRVLFQATADGKTAGDKILLVDGPEDVITQTGAELTYTVPTAGTHGPCDVYVAAGATCPDSVPGQPALRLKVTLVWTDPPANPLANNPLINDLNLVVESDGETYAGNDVQNGDSQNAVEQAAVPAARTAASLAHTLSHSHARTLAHTLSRLRAQVTVPLTAGARTSTIRVTGANVQQGTQKFALVVSGPLPLESPPPAPPSPPGPQGPAPPPAPAGDTVVLGVSLPLLVLAVAAGGGFAFTRMRRGSAPAAGGPGGGLPAGWRMLTDPSSGYAYYVGPSGQTQWEAPVQELKPTAAPPPPPGGTALPAGWTTGVDPSSGAKYYYNPSTKQSQWTPP